MSLVWMFIKFVPELDVSSSYNVTCKIFVVSSFWYKASYIGARYCYLYQFINAINSLPIVLILGGTSVVE